MSEYQYVASTYRVTSVNTSITAAFTAPDVQNLIIGKQNYFEVHTLVEGEGILPTLEVRIFGSISYFHKFYHPLLQQDAIIMYLQSTKECLMLGWKEGKVKALEKIDLSDAMGIQLKSQPVYASEHSSKMIALHIMLGNVKILSLNTAKGKFGESYNVRIEENTVLDMEFIEYVDIPQLCILYQTDSGCKFMGYYIHQESNDATPMEWSCDFNMFNYCRILPAPDAGLVAISDNGLVIVQNGRQSPHIQETFDFGKVYSQCRVDYFTWLVYCKGGRLLFVRFLDNPQIEYVGTFARAKCISMISDNLFYIGCNNGDSRVISITKNGEYEINTVQVYPNIAPIFDFVPVQLDRVNQRDVLTCSGNKNQGSIRYVRKGINTYTEAETEVGNANNIWGIKKQLGDQETAYLVLSFLDQTKVLQINEETMGEFVSDSFNHMVQSKIVGNIELGIIQITQQDISLYDENLQVQSKTNAQDLLSQDFCFQHAVHNNKSAFVVGNQYYLYKILFDSNQIQVANRYQSQYEIACLYSNDNFVALGLWTEIQIKILNQENFEEVWQAYLGGDILPRSLLMQEMESKEYLFCGLGDGHLLSYNLTDQTKNSEVIGNQGIILGSFAFNNTQYVMACCDNPHVIYSFKHRLYDANVNMDNISSMAVFNTSDFPDCLAVISNETLHIIGIEDVQKVSLTKYELGYTARRLILFEDGVVLLKNQGDQATSIQYLDRQTMSVVSSVSSDLNEEAYSLFQYEQLILLGVGIKNGYKDPEKGFIKVYRIQNQSFLYLFKIQTPGVALVMKRLQEDHIVAGIDKYVKVYTITDEQITEICDSSRHRLAKTIDTFDNFVVAGDLVKSITLYQFYDNQLQRIAQDFKTRWVTQVKFISKNLILVADCSNNFFLFRYNQNQVRLQQIGAFHLGYDINCLKEGKMSATTGDEILDLQQCLLFGTVQGCLGIVASLPFEIFKILIDLQNTMQERYPDAGLTKLDEYRGIRQDKNKFYEPCQNFIDGDYIQDFLKLSLIDQETIVLKIQSNHDNINLQSIQRLLLALAKLH